MKALLRIGALLFTFAFLAALTDFAADSPSATKPDSRRKLVMLIVEPEYETAKTLPKFAAQFLEKEFRVVVVSGIAGDNETSFDRIEEIADADVLLVSVRRRPPPVAQLAVIRACVQAGKPVVGIRTASHAFALAANQKLLPGTAEWREWDGGVLGGHYANHHANDQHPTLTAAPAAERSPLLAGVNLPFVSNGSLYKTSPLAAGATTLVSGKIPSQPEEPTAWTFVRKEGGRTFYTSLGHPSDCDQPAFQHLLLNGIRWAAGLR
jgi:type 1 glutamine amidotransferase